MTEEIEGQESATPTDEIKPGQELETDTPPVDTTEQIIKAATEAGESATPDETDGEKPPPYDQDPKWLAARAAEKRLGEMLEAHGVDDADELESLLKSGMTITEILGDRDAQQLIQDADTLKKYQEYWAEQDRLKAEKDLDPDELADKYKKELDSYKQTQAEKEAEAARIQEAKTAIANYNDRIGNIVENQKLDGDTAEIAKMFLGVDNPFNEVDISDQKAVKNMAVEGIEKFSKFLDNIRQQAIDDYAAGKSKIIPITSTETPPERKSVKKKEVPKDASVDETFAIAQQELLEIIGGGTSP